MNKEKGSILVLTLISVLILSLMALGLLSVGATENFTTQNYHLNKMAYYTALRGVEEMRNMIFNNPQVDAVTQMTKSLTETEIEGDHGITRAYISGSLKNLEDEETSPISMFEGFDAPPLPGLSMGTGMSVASVVWKVHVTSKVSMGGRSAFSEILTGVYSLIVTGYN